MRSQPKEREIVITYADCVSRSFFRSDPCFTFMLSRSDSKCEILASLCSRTRSSRSAEKREREQSRKRKGKKQAKPKRSQFPNHFVDFFIIWWLLLAPFWSFSLLRENMGVKVLE